MTVTFLGSLAGNRKRGNTWPDYRRSQALAPTTQNSVISPTNMIPSWRSLHDESSPLPFCCLLLLDSRFCSSASREGARTGDAAAVGLSAESARAGSPALDRPNAASRAQQHQDVHPGAGHGRVQSSGLASGRPPGHARYRRPWPASRRACLRLLPSAQRAGPSRKREPGRPPSGLHHSASVGLPQRSTQELGAEHGASRCHAQTRQGVQRRGSQDRGRVLFPS